MNKQQLNAIRDEYLALTDEQEKVDFLWSRRLSGGQLHLAPHQYPDAEPKHEPCRFCGGAGVVSVIGDNWNTPNNIVVRCTRCGRETERNWSPQGAWRDWDDGEIVEGQQMNLFDMMGDE